MEPAGCSKKKNPPMERKSRANSSDLHQHLFPCSTRGSPRIPHRFLGDLKGPPRRIFCKVEKVEHGGAIHAHWIEPVLMPASIVEQKTVEEES